MFLHHSLPAALGDLGLEMKEEALRELEALPESERNLGGILGHVQDATKHLETGVRLDKAVCGLAKADLDLKPVQALLES